MNAFSNDHFTDFSPDNLSRKADLAAELAYVRAKSASRRLSPFYRNAAGWELAMLLAISQGNDEAGIYDTVEAITSKALGRSALLKFIQEQARAGSLHIETSPVKRSKRIIRLDPSLVDEMTQLLERRSRLTEDFRTSAA